MGYWCFPTFYSSFSLFLFFFSVSIEFLIFIFFVSIFHSIPICSHRQMESSRIFPLWRSCMGKKLSNALQFKIRKTFQKLITFCIIFHFQFWFTIAEPNGNLLNRGTSTTHFIIWDLVFEHSAMNELNCMHWHHQHNHQFINCNYINNIGLFIPYFNSRTEQKCISRRCEVWHLSHNKYELETLKRE